MGKGNFRIKHILYAVTIVAAFFMFNFFQSTTEEVVNTKLNHEQSKTIRTQYFNELLALNDAHMNKKISDLEFIEKRNAMFPSYKESRKVVSKNGKALTLAYENQKFLHFKSIQHFFGEFWCVGLLLFMLRYMVKVFHKRDEDWLGDLITGGAMTFVAIFYTGYLLINVSDYSFVQYMGGILITTFLMIMGVYYSVKYELWYKKRQDTAIRSLTDFIVQLTPRIKEEDVPIFKTEAYKLIKEM